MSTTEMVEEDEEVAESERGSDWFGGDVLRSVAQPPCNDCNSCHFSDEAAVRCPCGCHD